MGVKFCMAPGADDSGVLKHMLGSRCCSGTGGLGTYRSNHVAGAMNPYIYSEPGCTPDGMTRRLNEHGLRLSVQYPAVHFLFPLLLRVSLRTPKKNLCQSINQRLTLCCLLDSSFPSSLILPVAVQETRLNYTRRGFRRDQRQERQSIIATTTTSFCPQQHHNYNETQHRIEPVHDLDNISPWLKHNRGWSTRIPSLRRTQTIRQSRRR